MQIQIILTLLLSVAAESKENCSHTKDTFNCVRYLKNYDGDTITVNIPGAHPLIGQKISIRIKGIDTPEIKTSNSCEKAKGRTAKKFLKSYLKNAKRIDLVYCSRGKYFRLVCGVRADGKDLASLLIKNNLAYSYNGGAKKDIDWCGRVPASN